MLRVFYTKETKLSLNGVEVKRDDGNEEAEVLDQCGLSQLGKGRRLELIDQSLLLYSRECHSPSSSSLLPGTSITLSPADSSVRLDHVRTPFQTA